MPPLCVDNGQGRVVRRCGNRKEDDWWIIINSCYRVAMQWCSFYVILCREAFTEFNQQRGTKIERPEVSDQHSIKYIICELTVWCRVSKCYVSRWSERQRGRPWWHFAFPLRFSSASSSHGYFLGKAFSHSECPSWISLVRAGVLSLLLCRGNIIFFHLLCPFLTQQEIRWNSTRR